MHACPPWRRLHRERGAPAAGGSDMFKKIVIGMALFAGACLLAAAGYRFGQALAQAERDAAPATAATR